MKKHDSKAIKELEEKAFMEKEDAKKELDVFKMLLTKAILDFKAATKNDPVNITLDFFIAKYLKPRATKRILNDIIQEEGSGIKRYYNKYLDIIKENPGTFFTDIAIIYKNILYDWVQEEIKNKEISRLTKRI